MNDSEHDFISSEVLTNFGKTMGRSQVDPDRLREALALTVAQHPDQAELKRFRDLGAHPFELPSNGDGFELRLGHHDLEMLNSPGAVAGEYVSLGVVKTEEIAVVASLAPTPPIVWQRNAVLRSRDVRAGVSESIGWWELASAGLVR